LCFLGHCLHWPGLGIGFPFDPIGQVVSGLAICMALNYFADLLALSICRHI